MKTLRTLLVLCALISSASLSAIPLERQQRTLLKQIGQLRAEIDRLQPTSDSYKEQVLELQGAIKQRKKELQSVYTQQHIGRAVHARNEKPLDVIVDQQLREDLRVVLRYYFEETGKDKKYPLEWCPCNNAGVEQRFLLIAQMARDIAANHETTEPLVCMSYGSGNLLQEYLLHKLLDYIGFKAINWVLIDNQYDLNYFAVPNESIPVFNFAKSLNIKGMGGMPGHAPLKKRLWGMKKRGETELDFIPLTENVREQNASNVLVFDSAQAYVEAIKNNSSMKADVAMMVDSSDVSVPLYRDPAPSWAIGVLEYGFRNILKFSLTQDASEKEAVTYVMFDRFSDDFRIVTSEKKEVFQKNEIAQIFMQEGLSTKQRFEKLATHFEPLPKGTPGVFMGKALEVASGDMKTGFFSALPRVLAQPQRAMIYRLDSNTIEKIDPTTDFLSHYLRGMIKYEKYDWSEVFTPAEFRQFISD